MDDLEKTISDFEEKMSEAIGEKYADQSPEHKALLLRSNEILRFDIMAFYKAYMTTDQPKDHLRKLVHVLFDIKMQMFYIGQVDMGLYNRILYTPNYNPQTLGPYGQLKKLSLDQGVIVKSRILWERMMNFASVYITGDELEASGKKSKKKKFSEVIEGTPWIFLKDYWKTLQWFDDTLRTPEVHGGSVLRKNFQHSEENDDSLLVLYNIATNLFYPNIMAIAAGHEPPYKVWTIGMQEENKFEIKAEET